jgi:hypothetical protein
MPKNTATLIISYFQCTSSDLPNPAILEGYGKMPYN